MFRRLIINNVNNGGIVSEKYDTFICHYVPPNVNSNDNGKKLQKRDVIRFPVVRPSSVKPMAIKDRTKT